VKAFPHRYVTTAAATARGDVVLETSGAPSLSSAAPVEFDGLAGRWSPETLLVSAVGDCFVLTFRAIARAAKLPFATVFCEVAGTLDRVDGVIRFTRFDVRARLVLPAEGDLERARHLLEKAERGCLIANSLNGEVHLVVSLERAATAVA
jgi:organic hydroperoxide reductase OsmC/OhrA